MDQVIIRQMQKQSRKKKTGMLYKGQTKWNLGPKALKVIKQVFISYKN